VRWRDGPKFFGFKLTQQQEKIASGEIPPPIALSDSGRAKGWLGQQIIEHQQKRLAAAQAEGAKKKPKAVVR
jgi:predicted DNA-binding transcriptional regulator AlpA